MRQELYKSDRYWQYHSGYHIEDASWKLFCEEAFDKFLKGTYKGEYQDKLIAEFERRLPEVPPWKK